MKTREEYAAVCLKCTKRKNSMKIGVICGLTQAHAAYSENDCPDFEMDEVAAKKLHTASTQKKKDLSTSFYAGIGIILAAVLWLAVGIFFGRLFIYPIILLGGGIILTVKYAPHANPSSKKEETFNDDLV